MYPKFVEEISDTLRRDRIDESAVLLGDFNARVGKNVRIWNVPGRRGDAASDNDGRLVLQLCCNSKLCIMNTLVQRGDVHKCTWCRDSLGPQSHNDFFIVSADLFRSALDVCVKH